MDEVIIPGRDSDRSLFERVVSRYDAPAYIRRARNVEEAEAALKERCRHQREEWLDMVRLRLGTLRDLAGDWRALTELVVGDDLEVLASLEAELQPRLRVRVPTTCNAKALRAAVAELNESVERFNRRWSGFLDEVDLGPLNELRDGYNRYYVLEKECCVRSSRLATHGFVRLEPLTVQHLEAWWPRLPLIRLERGG